MVEEEFTEEDFEDEPKQSLTPRPSIKPSNPPATTQRKPQPQQQQQQSQIPATRDVAAPTEKFTPYSMPARVGIFDNELGRPILEDVDTTGVILALLTKIANDVDEIKGRL